MASNTTIIAANQAVKDTMLEGLKNRILKSKDLPNSVKEILLPHCFPFKDYRDTSILEKLLTTEPVESKLLSDELMEKIKSVPEVFYGLSLVTSINKTLEKVFAYDTEISQNKGRAYQLTHEQGRYTCTYCNRTYTLTVVRTDSQQPLFPGHGKTNDKNRIARPHIDHWFDKAKNPRFPFIVEIDESLCDVKEREMIRSLALKDIYSYHGMLEAKDIIDWRI